MGDILMLKGVLLAWLLCGERLVVGNVVVHGDVVGDHGVYRERSGEKKQ
jgi:hypothetical protein